MKVKLMLQSDPRQDPQTEEKNYVELLERIWRNFPTAIWSKQKDCFEIEI